MLVKEMDKITTTQDGIKGRTSIYQNGKLVLDFCIDPDTGKHFIYHYGDQPAAVLREYGTA